MTINSPPHDIVSSFFYVTDSPGIGGLVKIFPEDFIVSEITNSGYRLDPRSTVFLPTSGHGLFLHCVLIKKGWTTDNALSFLSRFWHVPRNYFGFAGTKDKNAFTAQRISVWGVKDRFKRGDLKEVNMETLKVRFLGLELNEVRLGDLLGNFFEIVIRSIDREESEVRNIFFSTISQINEFHGVPNFFGLQRFGETRPITHLVGKMLILNGIAEAFRYYIGKSFEGENPAVAKARKLFWDTGDAVEALKIFPSVYTIERKILSLLVQTNYNYRQVFNHFSLQFRKLFIHAYQSYLFNKYLKIRYYSFKQDFSSPISGEKVSNNKILAPLLGFNITLEGYSKDIYQSILDYEGLDFSLFNAPLVKKLGARGAYRPILFEPKNVRLLNCSEDEHTPAKLKLSLSFALDKGSYATVFLREIMKNY